MHHGTVLEEGEPTYNLPDITEYGIRVPFCFAVIGQTDSGKTYSIMQRWLGGKISYWTSVSGRVQEVKLQHCLYCNNGNVSLELKQELVNSFIIDDSQQRIFHLDRFPTRDDILNFISSTSIYNAKGSRKRKSNDVKMVYQ